MSAVILKFDPRLRRIRGVCGDCIWSCGVHGKNCGAPSVQIETGIDEVHSVIARNHGKICGPDATYWSPKPHPQETLRAVIWPGLRDVTE